MKIKNKILILFLAAFLLTTAHNSHADISIDDMGSLLEDETVVVESGKEAGKSQTQSVGGVVADIDKAIENSFSNAGTGSGALHDNLVLIIVGGLCGLFFITVLYFLYLKTKKLSEETQVSKDLAEKYFYDIQGYKEGCGKIKDEVEARIRSIDDEIGLKVKEIDRVLIARIKEIFEKVRDGEEFTEFVLPRLVNLRCSLDDKRNTTPKDHKIDTEISDIITSVEKAFNEKGEKSEKNGIKNILDKEIIEELEASELAMAKSVYVDVTAIDKMLEIDDHKEDESKDVVTNKKEDEVVILEEVISTENSDNKEIIDLDKIQT